MKQKVYVGLSGGVDSAVSALLLKDAGFEVVGVYLRGWQPDWITCTWKDDRISAMRTAASLDIPFLTLDFEDIYKTEVADYILREYKKGNTPNGDMLCNREIKFGAFLKWVLSEDLNAKVATGHYAQNILDENTGLFNLLKSKDQKKDQTYFLSQIKQEELKHILFPIGHLEKSEVRSIASKNGLRVADRPDSQGICFVGEMDMSEFLKRELGQKIGDLKNLSGDIIGKHEGAHLYTIGQKHGFNILNINEKTPKYIVVKKDIESNIIFVDIEENFLKNKNQGGILKIKNFSNTGREILVGEKLDVLLRYRGKFIEALIEETNEDQIIIKNISEDVNFEDAAEGQFAVLYDKDVCLGGGEIFFS